MDDKFYNLTEENDGQGSFIADSKTNEIFDTYKEKEIDVIEAEELNALTTKEDVSFLLTNGRFDPRKFMKEFGDNTERVFNALMNLQSNANPLKKGGDSIAFRADFLILQNRAKYEPIENLFLDVVLAYVSSRPEDDVYTIYIEDIQRMYPNFSLRYCTEILRAGKESFGSKKISFIYDKESGKSVDFAWNEVIDRENSDKFNVTYVTFKPTKFFKLIAISASVAHGAYYNLDVVSRIKGSYSKSLFYFFEMMKKYKKYPTAEEGVFPLYIDEVRELLNFPSSTQTKYLSFKLRNWIDEINNTEGIDIIIHILKPLKEGTALKGYLIKVSSIYMIEENDSKVIIDKSSPEVSVLLGFDFTDKDTKDILYFYKKYDRDIGFLSQAIASVTTSFSVHNRTAVLCHIMKNGLKQGMTMSENVNRIKEQIDKAKNKNPGFNDFAQRDYDYDELEKLLLSQ